MYSVYNQRLAGRLMTKGFKLVSIRPNNKLQGFNVFEFEETPELVKIIKEYQLNRSSNNGANKKIISRVS